VGSAAQHQGKHQSTKAPKRTKHKAYKALKRTRCCILSVALVLAVGWLTSVSSSSSSSSSSSPSSSPSSFDSLTATGASLRPVSRLLLCKGGKGEDGGPPPLALSTN